MSSPEASNDIVAFEDMIDARDRVFAALDSIRDLVSVSGPKHFITDEKHRAWVQRAASLTALRQAQDLVRDAALILDHGYFRSGAKP